MVFFFFTLKYLEESQFHALFLPQIKPIPTPIVHSIIASLKQIFRYSVYELSHLYFQAWVCEVTEELFFRLIWL